MPVNTLKTSLWHPFTQMKNAAAPFKVRSGHGALLTLENGVEIIDGISSWWVNLHGHGEPRISAAIYRQALQLEHVMFAGFTHEPAELLAEKLLPILPRNLKKIFFSDNGSTAVEVALKQAFQYWRNLGEMQRTRFLCFEGGYHGDTVGAMSVGARSLFTHAFNNLLFDVEFAPYPAIEEGKDIEALEQASLEYISSIFQLSPNRYAAIVIEPLVQGAGGMRMCRPEFLSALQAVAKKNHVLLIYDEVMTGFGRTGDFFACTKSQTQPDIICLSKGLTGGFLPLAVTVCSDEVFNAFYSDDFNHTFFHGHTYTANPLGCAAACASIDLLIENAKNFQEMEIRHKPYLNRMKEKQLVANTRCCGTIAAMELVVPGQEAYGSELSKRIRAHCLAKGLLVRPIGNVVYLMPPYCITDVQLEQAYAAIESACV